MAAQVVPIVTLARTFCFCLRMVSSVAASIERFAQGDAGAGGVHELPSSQSRPLLFGQGHSVTLGTLGAEPQSQNQRPSSCKPSF